MYYTNAIIIKAICFFDIILSVLYISIDINMLRSPINLDMLHIFFMINIGTFHFYSIINMLDCSSITISCSPVESPVITGVLWVCRWAWDFSKNAVGDWGDNEGQWPHNCSLRINSWKYCTVEQYCYHRTSRSKSFDMASYFTEIF